MYDAVSGTLRQQGTPAQLLITAVLLINNSTVLMHTGIMILECDATYQACRDVNYNLSPSYAYVVSYGDFASSFSPDTLNFVPR